MSRRTSDKKRFRSEITLTQQESDEFMKRPISKVPDLNRNLRKSYENGFFKKKRFDGFRLLKEKVLNKDNDSV